MSTDYRFTRFEDSNSHLLENKQRVKALILQDHKRARDLHIFLKRNELPYKLEFIKAYGCKCSYCGVSVDIIDKRQFEIDHFIPCSNTQYFSKKSDAGYIENLVLACFDCNRNKHNYCLPKEYWPVVHPDYEEVTNYFIRDDEYYIKISNEYLEDQVIIDYYKKLRLSEEFHRLDYLIMNMIGMRDQFYNDDKLVSLLSRAIQKLLSKRHLF